MKRTIIAAALSTFCISTPGSAKSSLCKNLDPSACRQSTQCLHVRSYKTKTGKEVKAYCRKASRNRRTKPKDPIAPIKKAFPKPTARKLSAKPEIRKKPRRVKRWRQRRSVRRRRR